jgi:hypothetical protein
MILFGKDLLKEDAVTLSYTSEKYTSSLVFGLFLQSINANYSINTYSINEYQSISARLHQHGQPLFINLTVTGMCS